MDLCGRQRFKFVMLTLQIAVTGLCCISYTSNPHSWQHVTMRLFTLHFLHPEKAPASRGQVRFPLRVSHGLSMIHIDLNNACCWLPQLPDQRIHHLMLIPRCQQPSKTISVSTSIKFEYGCWSFIVFFLWKMYLNTNNMLIWLECTCLGHWSGSE